MNSASPIASLIYDVGLNDGDDSAYYLRNGFDVVAIEANPVLAERARRRFAKEIGDGRMTVLEVGIAEGEDEATFWICEDQSDWSSFNRATASRNGARHRAITVRLRPFGEILQEHGVPYYCKIDIEGNDHLCVSAMTPQVRPAFISAEFAEDAVASDQFSRLDQFAGLGYDRFKLVQQQGYGPPNPALQARKARMPHAKLAGGLERANGLLRGRLVDGGWYFRRGSSGPLPDRTAGPWLSPEQIRIVLTWVADHAVEGDWFDLYATTADVIADLRLD